MAINCKTVTAQGRIETNKESELNKKLIELFPNKINSEGGSQYYDELFTERFKQFFGDWTNKSSKWNDYYSGKDHLFDTLGEPKLIGPLNSEYYFTDATGQQYILNKRYLSNKDLQETINSLSLLYLAKPQKNINFFVKNTLEKRRDVLLDEHESIDSNIEDNQNTLSEEEIQKLETNLITLNNSIVSLDKDILQNDLIFQRIVKGIEANLADYNLKYIDDVSDKEDDDPNTNDEIQNFTKEASEIRDTNNINSEIKSIMAGIKDFNISIDNIENEKSSRLLNMPIAKPANEVKNLIVETLSNIIELELAGSNYISDPYDLMINKLKERFNDDGNIIIREFLNKIDKVYNSKSENDKEAFKTAFVTSFYKSQNVFTITEISEQNGKLILRHIDPASTQDKEAFISNDFTRNIFNKFNFTNNSISNEDIYQKASNLLRNFKSKKDIIEGLNLLDITLNPKTIDNLFKNKDNILNNITNQYKQSLKEFFTSLFEQEINYSDTEKQTEEKSVSKGLKTILRDYSKSNLATQKNILSSLTSKDNFTALNILSKYEAKNKTDLSDSSLFVGEKQRWMYSLVSGLNKEILTWKSGDISGLQKKAHKNLIFVNYLLDLDNVKAGKYLENSEENKSERNKRINNLKLIINSEIKKVNDSNSIQHKEIGEADLHMDIFFKMFNNKDEIYDKIDKQQGITQQLNNKNNTKVIFNYPFSADKSGSYGIFGFAALDNTVELDSNNKIKSLGLDNQTILKNYLLGEFNVIKNHSNLIQGYLDKKTKKQKQEYLMQYLIPEYHYVTTLETPEGKIKFNPENQEETLDYRFINNAPWNKFGFFNSVYEANKDEFNLLFKNVNGINLADNAMQSHITNKLYKLAEEEVIRIAENNLKYLNNIVIEDNFNGVKSLFDKATNIKNSTSTESRYNYAVNSIFSNLEMFNLFNGDLAFYKQKGLTLNMEDALKRGPAILTDGLYIRQTNKANIQEYTTFNNKKLKVDKNKEVVTAILNVLENDKSKYADQISKQLGNTINYKHEIADAAGYITLDFYKKVISGVYGWTDSDEKHFIDLQNKNHKYTDKDIKWLKQAGRSLQPLKLTGFNLEDIKNEEGDILGQYPVYLKYSTAVLAPAIIGGTDLENLHNQMKKQNVDQVLFKSGSKASNRQATTIFNKEDGIFSGLKKDMVLNPFIFSIKGLKLQVELPTKFDKDGVLGNQHLKNLLANLDLKDNTKTYNYRNEKLTAKELFDKYDFTIKDILQNQLDKIIEDLNITHTNEIKSFDETKLRQLIIDQLDINNDGDLIDILSDNSLPIESIPGIAQRTFPILSSHIHKNVGKVITNAGSAIQIANIGFDRISNEDANNVIYLTEDKELRPPLLEKDEQDNKIIKNARIMLPFSSVYEQTGMSYEELKKAIEENKIDKRIFNNIIGYRIPNQSISSNDAIEVVGILPPNIGDSAIVYHEITAKTGSDFDIDKLYLMMPNFKINDDNTISYIDDDSPKGRQNQLIELMQSILNNEKSYDDLMSPLDSDIPKDAINEVLYLKYIAKDNDYEIKLKAFNSLKDDKKSKFLKEFSSKRKLNPLEQLSPMGMVKARVDMLQAKKLVATMANHMTDIPMSQIVNQIIKYDLGVDSFSFSNIFTKGYENNNEYKLTKIVSYLMNAAVDAAKDNYIIEGNFNSYAANGAMTMIRLGVDPVNVFKVLMNDEVLKLSKIKQSQTQKITSINKEEYNQENLNNYSKNLINYIQSNKINYNDFIINNDNFPTEHILGFWNIIQLAGKELNNDILTSKTDSNGAGKNIYEHHVLLNRLERLKVESIGSIDNDNFVRGKKIFKSGISDNSLEFTNNLHNSDYTFLGSMMNNSLLLTNFLAKNMFIEATDNYRNIVNRTSNQFGEALPVDTDNIKLISNYIYPYILSQSGHQLYNIDEAQVNYLTKDFANEVITKKALNPDNLFLKQLYIDTNTNLISFPNYRFFDSNSKILLKEALEEIYNQRDIENQLTGPKFINRLVKYAFLTTGFKPTFFSMNEYLPKSYFLNTGHGYFINKLITKLNNSSEFTEDESLKNMMTFMAINNDINYKIVASLNSADGLSSNTNLINKKTLKKVNITDTDNFYPFIKNKKADLLYMLTNVEELTDKENNTHLIPTYNLINSNSEVVDTENNNNLKRKTKVKLFDLNTIKPDNLFIREHTSNSLFIQSEITYKSELANLFENNNLTVQNDSISLQEINNMENNKELNQDNTYGLSNEEWNNLTEEEQIKIKECN